jgi:hypothetical protein
MSNVKSLMLLVLAMIALSVLFPFVVLSGVEEDSDQVRADRIIIELDAENSKQEMPAVAFSHDLHTQATEGKCVACHTETEGGFVFKFKRTTAPATMELYHEACFACHAETKSANKKSGPLEAQCRACHVENLETATSWVDIVFTKSLHYIHEKNKTIKSKDPKDQRNCSACHHNANNKSKKIFPAKGEEASCSYCHKPRMQDNVRSLRQASHDSCVRCHQTMIAKDMNAGPVTCEGCHTTEGQKVITVLADVPRLDRNQPDMIAVKAWKDNRADAKNYMAAVPFDHQSHEAAVDSCKVCHHQTLNKCTDCHEADGGTLKGGFVSLSQAMHDKNALQSCVGCHKEITTGLDCAGCHGMMPSDRKKDPESCKLCHAIAPDQLTRANETYMVKEKVNQRRNSYTKVVSDKIPETVKIGILSNEYQPSVFPHKKVMEAIAVRVEKSPLANTFHNDQAGLCMGCHHNSPRTLEPPKCASCHSRNSDGADGMPGLMGAYHGQCIGCHQKMKIERLPATDCVKCHEVKK